MDLILCAVCGFQEQPHHGNALGHSYAPARWTMRDDQVRQKSERPTHYNIKQYRIVPIVKPAVGIDAIAKVPVTTRWRCYGLAAQLTTSAVIVNRVPHLIIKDDQGNVVYNFPSGGNQVASTVGIYSAGMATVAAAFDGATVLVLPIDFQLLQNWSIGFLTTALDAGDQWSNFALLVKEWLTF
jgi:hypothetical protein